ncbi:MAG: hypothetical protein R3B72_05685 [Polyangiaceae bacterium]
MERASDLPPDSVASLASVDVEAKRARVEAMTGLLRKQIDVWRSEAIGPAEREEILLLEEQLAGLRGRLTSVSRSPAVRQSGLRTALDEAQAAIPGCLAVAAVDMASGLILEAVSTMKSKRHEALLLDLMGAATADFYRGRVTKMIEEEFSARRGTPWRRYIQDVIAMTDRYVHIALRSRAHPDLVTVLVFSAFADLDTTVAASRLYASKIDRWL